MAGMNLMDMIMGAQGGDVVSKLGGQLGLDDTQTKSAVAALLPALSSGLKRNASQPGGLEALVGALQKGDHHKYLDEPERLGAPETIQDGNAILGHLLGSKDVSRAAASKASAQTGLSDCLMKQMLPMLATLAMGSLSKQNQDNNIAGQLMGALSGQPQGGTQGGGGLLGSVLGAVMGGGKKAPAQGGSPLGQLGNLLDADGDGNAMDDIFDMLSKR